MYSFENRFKSLISLDIIRICKIFEILQYSFIFLVLLVITMYFMNKFYYSDKYDLDNKIDHSDNKTKKKFKIFWIVFRDTFIIILLLFYIRKIALLFPSIPNLLYPKFFEHSTLEYSIHIALVVVFIELLPKYKNKIHELKNIISDD